jgi:hypothetical protein
MRWMAGLRECMKWVMLTEYQQKWFYDIVVRLRDDTYALGPWVITPSYFGALTSSSNGIEKSNSFPSYKLIYVAVKVIFGVLMIIILLSIVGGANHS